MKKTVSAIFDSRDAAELALLSLHRSNIPLISMCASDCESIRKKQDVFYMAPIFCTRGVETTNQSVTPLPIVTYPLNAYRKHLADDVLSRDVRLQVEVPDNFSNRARKTMISCHGHNVCEL